MIGQSLLGGWSLEELSIQSGKTKSEIYAHNIDNEYGWKFDKTYSHK